MSLQSRGFKLLRTLYRLLLSRQKQCCLWLDAACSPGARELRCRIERLQPRLMFSFTPTGSEFLVNLPTTGNHQTPAVAVDAAGDSLAVWSGQYPGGHCQIYGQRYNSSGLPIGSQFVVDQTSTQDQTQPKVAMNDSGSFVVTWTSKVNNQDVFARAYSPLGIALTNEFAVNSVTNGKQLDPAVGIDSAGNFVVVWDGAGTADDQGIYEQAYLAGGIASGGNVLVNTTTNGNQTNPTIAMNALGESVIGWTDANLPGGKIQVQRYAAGGIATGGNTLIGTSTNASEDHASAGIDGLGNFAVAWTEDLPDPNKRDIFLRRYGVTGLAIDASPVTVNTYTSDDQDSASVFTRSDGSCFVAWMSNNEDGNNEGVYTQAFAANGNRDGGELQANTTTQGPQQRPAIAVSASGQAVVAWDGQDSVQNQGIAAQRFLVTAVAPPNQAPIVTLPAIQNGMEDSQLVFSAANSNALTVSDSDANGGTEQVTLAATNGTISLASTGSISISSGTGSGDTSVTFAGTLANLNAAMSGLTFAPAAHFFGTAGVSVTINDLGHSGAGGALTASGSISINVARLAHTPTVSNATANENSQSTRGLVISPSTLDSGMTGYFKITSIAGGTLYQNDGITPIPNGSYITFAQGQAGLTFSPATDSVAAGSFVTQASTSASDAGLGGASVSTPITVNPAPRLTLPATQSTVEDTGLVFSTSNGNAISVSDPGVPAGTATLTIVATGGVVSLGTTSGVTLNSGVGSSDASVSVTGAFSALNNVLKGLTFTPALNTFGAAGINVVIQEGPNSASGNIQIAVTRVAHTPAVSGAAVNENSQSSMGLVIAPDSRDSGMGGYFKITGVTGGTLFQNNGTSPIASGSFITFAQGQAGLKFSPSINSTSAGSFAAQASTSVADAGLGGSAVLAQVTVNPVPSVSVPAAQTTSEDTTLAFSTANANPIAVSDPGNSGGAAQITLTGGNGTVGLATSAGLSFSSGSNNTSSMTFTGTLAAINRALDGLTFTPATHYTGSGASVSIMDNEGVNAASASVPVRISAVAHTPSATDATTNENQQTTSGLVISPDPNDLALLGYFYITNISGGTLFQNDGITRVTGGSFISFAQGEAGLRFTPFLNSAATGSFYVQTSTLAGLLGLSGSQIAPQIRVFGVPQTSAPLVATTTEDTPLTFSSATSNALTATDPADPAAIASATLSVSNGTLTLGSTSGLVFTGGADASASMSFRGTLSAITSALDGLVFNADTHFSGAPTMSFSASEGPNASTSRTVINVNRAAHTPSVTSTTTNVNEPTSNGALVVTPAALDAGLAGYLKVSRISHGALFQADGVTAINNGDFITFAQGAAGLIFAPNRNSSASGAFTIQASTAASDAGLGGAAVTAAVQVEPVPQASVPAAISTLEDMPLIFQPGGNALVVSDPENPGGTVSVTVTATGGTISLGTTSGVTIDAGSGAGDVSVSFTGLIPDLNAALDGLSFLPTQHTFGAAGLALTVREGGNSANASTAITVTRVAHSPSVSDAVANENTQTNSGLIITPNSLDVGLAGSFRVTQIVGGALYQADGSTLINDGDFISFAQGAAGLKFTPLTNSLSSGSFNLQASTAASAAGLGGAVVTATVSLRGVPSVTAPPSGALLEDQSVSFSSIGGNALMITDAGGPTGTVVLTLSAADGALTLASVAGISFANGTANGESALTISGTMSSVNHAVDGLTYVPSLHYSGADTLVAQASEGPNLASATVSLTITRVAHTPAATDAATVPGLQTAAGLVLSPSPTDAGMAGWFKITQISNGTLYQQDGVTPINDGDFITFSQGEAGLRFAPPVNSMSNGSFSLQASTSPADAGLGGAVIEALIRVDQAPVLTTSPGSLTYVEASGAIAVDAGLTLSDADDATLAGATVRLNGYQPGDDLLAFDNQNGITGAWDANAGVLTLSGSASVAAYQQALRSVRYSNLNPDPAPVTLTAEFSASDGILSSAAATRSIAVLPLNDPPVISGPAARSLVEDHALLFSPAAGSAITVSDSDGGSSVEQVTVEVLNGTVSLGHADQVSLVSGTGTGDQSVTFTGPLSRLNAALDGLTFTPRAHASGAAGLTITINDLGNSGAGGALSEELGIPIDISVVVHSPSMTGAVTAENHATGMGLVIAPNPLDATLAAYYRISQISGGSLYQHDDATPIPEGTFITFADGAAGLVFQPAENSVAPGVFFVQASTAASNDGLGGDAIAGSVTVLPEPIAAEESSLQLFQGSPQASLGDRSLNIVRADGSRPAVVDYQLLSLPAHGDLRLGGATLVAGSTFTQADVSGGRLMYVAGAGQLVNDSFTFAATDAEGATVGPVTFTVQAAPTPATPTPLPAGQSFAAPAQGANATFAIADLTGDPTTTSASDSSASRSDGSQGNDASGSTQSQAPARATLIFVPSREGSQNDNGGLLLKVARGTAVVDLVSLPRGLIGSGAQASGAGGDSAELRSNWGLSTELLNGHVVDPLLRETRLSNAGHSTTGLTADRRFWKELDAVEQQAASTAPVRVWAGTASAVSAGMSVLYFLWTLRAGSLLSSLLSSMPAWKMVDPLPILDTVGGAAGGLRIESEEDEGLQELVEGGGE